MERDMQRDADSAKGAVSKAAAVASSLQSLIEVAGRIWTDTSASSSNCLDALQSVTGTNAALDTTIDARMKAAKGKKDFTWKTASGEVGQVTVDLDTLSQLATTSDESLGALAEAGSNPKCPMWAKAGSGGTKQGILVQSGQGTQTHLGTFVYVKKGETNIHLAGAAKICDTKNRTLAQIHSALQQAARDAGLLNNTAEAEMKREEETLANISAEAYDEAEKESQARAQQANEHIGTSEAKDKATRKETRESSTGQSSNEAQQGAQLGYARGDEAPKTTDAEALLGATTKHFALAAALAMARRA
ncbi:hypothetical protein ERJ75_000793600 [Trypanosoma vivax]|uniref:Uncharacterized protein n=1 Tax=Trypanosoma vivax (strain Y486) TaxID=1055687 RepID=F9WKM7_TRYVY|nr:hypothetical protein ERJ75_000793600 [Trypanosoma vivax]CCD18049.1 hypothetical protein, conserved in T. vivax [Trypanosoma vivax Y486]|eukprot:CCD18049.1 hypothetical protein, conserved in T. vivax [Trypanosoma vivax Y486]